jgi:hypothetical protein
MKVAVATLIAIVLVLAWLLNAETKTTREQQNQIAALTSKLADKVARENLELQQKCAQQAEKIFMQLGYRMDRPTLGISATYQSHYNAKLGKCFMTLDSTGAGDHRFLFDAYEQREYAEYMAMPARLNCKLIPSSGRETLCKSEEEYKAFAATYME